MGTDGRAKQMARDIALGDERQLKALENNDTAMYFTISLYNVFAKCGNCGWRMKCANGLLDRMFSEHFKDADLDAGVFTNSLLKVFDFLNERLGDEDFHTMINMMLTDLDMTLDEMVEQFDKMFSKCIQYGFIPGVQSGGEQDE